MKSIAKSAWHAVLTAMPDRLALSILLARTTGRWPDLKNPRTHNERVQARKLANRDPRLPLLADKLAVKPVVADLLGTDWITPTLWSGPELPPRDERTWPTPYVIKANHGCGQVIIVRDPAQADWDHIETTTRRWLTEVHNPWAREWLYSQITPTLLVEPFIGDGPEPPEDYKFYVFGGKVRYVHIDTDRFTHHRRAVFDRDWNPVDFGITFPPEKRPLPRPHAFEEMRRGAELLGREFDFVRVDLYDVAGTPRFGELTFYPGSGAEAFIPYEMDRAFGDLWPQAERVV